jgi:hypothetical protein
LLRLTVLLIVVVVLVVLVVLLLPLLPVLLIKGIGIQCRASQLMFVYCASTGVKMIRGLTARTSRR